VLLLAAAASLPGVSLTLQLAQSGWPVQRDDSIAAFERHMAPLRDALRAQPTVGYLPPGGSLEAPGGAAHLYRTRYTLAPVIVVNTLVQPLIIADGVADPSRLPAGLEVVRDFGGGLLLLRTLAP
jgi:hypothetical protein